jgi:membrane protein
MGLLRGRSTRSSWRLGPGGIGGLLRKIWHQVYEDELLGRAAELAYFFLFSVFPLLLFLTTLLGYLARESWPLGRELFRFVSSVSPSREVTSLLRDTLEEITKARSGGKLSLGILVALIAASNAVMAVGRTLNRAYGLRERRPWWRRRLEAAVLVMVFAVLIVTALALIFFGERIADSLLAAFDLGPMFGWAWPLAQWAVVVFCAVFSFDLVFNFAPDRRVFQRVWLTPGAVVGVALWLAASYGFRYYLDYFGYYSRTYGSLGAVIVLMLWFYLTGAAMLIGGEINSEIDAFHAGSGAGAGNGSGDGLGGGSAAGREADDPAAGDGGETGEATGDAEAGDGGEPAARVAGDPAEAGPRSSD